MNRAVGWGLSEAHGEAGETYLQPQTRRGFDVLNTVLPRLLEPRNL
jgi:hypothetical protein